MPREYLWNGVWLLLGAGILHSCHMYIASIPLAIVAVVLLGRYLQEELGL